MASVTFYIRSRGAEKATIYTSVSIPGDKIRLPTGEKCLSDHWVEAKARVKNTAPRAGSINLVLDKIEREILDHFTDCKLSRENPNPDKIKSIIKGKEASGDSPLTDLMKLFISESKSGERTGNDGKNISAGRIKGYNSTFKSVKDFLAYRQLPDKITSLSVKFADQWQEWQWETKGYYDNYVGTTGNIYNAFCEWLYETGKVKTKIPKAKKWKEDIDIIALYPKELRELSTWRPEDNHMEFIKDAFLLGCLTCLRVSNLLQLNESNIIRKDGEMWINVVSVKTDKQILIPLNSVGQGIVDKYIHQDPFFPISDQRFNINLKKMAKLFRYHLKSKKAQVNSWGAMTRTRYRKGKAVFEKIEFTDYISSHTMRRTGITSLLIAGLSEFEVKAISGHSFNSKDFKKYIKFVQSYLDTKVRGALDSIFK